MVELPPCPHFQNDVDVVLVVEVAVHLDDVGVAEVHLYLEFPYELLGDLLLLEQSFFDHFQCTDKACTFLSESMINLLYEGHLSVLA